METKIKTMDRGVRTFAVTDDSGYICIADDSASVLIYALNSLDGAMGKRFLGSDLEAQVKDITSVSLVRDCFKLGFKISWLPHRSITAVAIPSAEGVTTIFCRSGGRGVQDRAPVWEEIYLTTSTSATLTHGTADINIASFSPNGRYLATADTFGIILIWEVITNVGDNSISSEAFTVISMINTAPTGPLFDLVWGPIEGDNYLMLASLVGSGVAQNVIDISTGRLLPTGDIKISTKVNNTREVSLPKESGTATATKTYLPYRHREDAAIVSATKAVSESSTSAFSSPYSSIENITAANTAAAAVSVGDAPSSSAGKAVKFSRLQKSNPTVFDDDDDDEIQYDDTEGDTTAVTTKKILDDSDKEENRLDGDLDNDDEDTVVQEPNDIIANINRLAAGGGSTDSATSSVLMKLQTSIAILLAANAKAEKTAIAGPQVAFQPSSTTFDEKKKRYMVWNSIGNITCMDVGVNNRIEIRFTNTQRNRADAFNDNLNFTKAALSYEGALFSTEPEEDIDGDSLAKLKGSTIYYHAFPGQSVLQGANEVCFLKT